MSIIYSYPEQGVLNANDMLIGTSAEKVGGKQKNITRNFSIQQIADFVNGGTGVIDPVATDFQIAIFNQGGTKLTGSIMSQNTFPNGSEITITGNLITTGSITTPANLTATGNVSLGGGINVVNLNSRTNLYGLVGDSTGTLGSNNQILISDNAGALVWDDYAAGLTYQGVWNAATNTPTLVSGTGTNGHFYIVDVAGDTNLNSNTDWQVGDWALFSGVTGAGGFWDKIDNSSELTGSGGVNTLAMFTADKVLGDSLISQANAGLNSALVSVNASLKVRDTVEATSLNTNLKLKGAGTGGVEVMGDTTTQTDGKIQLNCYVNSHGVTIQSPPHSDSATYTLILPANVGNANQVLTSAGAGAGAQLTWSTPDTYDLSAGAKSGTSVPLNLTSGSGTDNSAVNLTEGTGITLTQTSATEITIAGTAQGITGSGTATKLPKFATSTSLDDSIVTQGGGTTTITPLNEGGQIPASINFNMQTSSFTMVNYATRNTVTGPAPQVGDVFNFVLTSDLTWAIGGGVIPAGTYPFTITFVGSGSLSCNFNSYSTTGGATGTGYNNLVGNGSSTSVSSLSTLSIAGELDMTTNQIKNVVNPTDAQDAATKNYVDSTSTGVTTFTNVNGDYISAATVNTAAVGAVTTGVIDLSAEDGTSDSTTRFLSKDNTWDVPSYTTDTDTTYTLSAGVLASNVIPLKLDASTGTDSAVNLKGGTGITLTKNAAGDEITMTGSAQGVTSLATGSSDTITLTGTGAGPFTGAVIATANTTAGVALGNANLATGGQIQSAIDSALSGALIFRGTFNAATGAIDGGSTFLYQVTAGGAFDNSAARVAVAIGDFYIANVAGNFYGTGGTALGIGDEAIAITAYDVNLSQLAGWSVVPAQSSGGTVTGTGTATQVAFWDAASNINGDGAFNWDNIDKSLGIGIASPNAKLDIASTSGLFFKTTASSTTDTNQHLQFNNNFKGWENTVYNSAFPINEVSFLGIGANGAAQVARNTTGAIGTNGAFPLLLGTSGTTRLSITSAGKIGIGIDDPIAKLHVYQNDTNTGTEAGVTIEQDGTGDATLSFLLSGTKRWRLGIDNSDSDKFKISDSTDLGTSDRLTIDTNGNVGIGTTSPDAKLEVSSTALTSGDARYELVITENNTASSGRGGGLAFSRQGTIFGGIKTLQNTSNNDNTTMYFQTRGSGVVSNRMVIDELGNVGIGTDDPATKLQVDSGSSIASFRSVGSGQNNKELLLKTGGDRFVLNARNADDETATDLTFESGGSEKMRIDSNGIVSIKNTGVPTLRLDNTDVSLTVQTLGSLEYYQNDPSDQGVGVVSRINCVNEGSFAGLGSLTFQTGTATSIAERMRITGAGGVSFGSSGTGYGSPNQVLTSNGNASPTWQAAAGLPTKTVVNLTGSNNPTLNLTVTPSSTAYVDLYVDGVYQNKNTFSVTGTILTLDSSAVFPTGVLVEAVITT